MELAAGGEMSLARIYSNIYQRTGLIARTSCGIYRLHIFRNEYIKVKHINIRQLATKHLNRFRQGERSTTIEINNKCNSIII